MASMNRNLNLEEVNSDAFLGIPFLQHQSFFQKVILIGSIVLAIAMNLVGNFFLKLNANPVVMLTLLPLLIGVFFGCNYNEDLSLFRFLFLLFFKPVVTLRFRPNEDLAQVRSQAEGLHKAQELKKKREDEITREEQKKLLIRLLIGMAVFVIVLSGILAVIRNLKTEEVHHDVVIEEVLHE